MKNAGERRAWVLVPVAALAAGCAQGISDTSSEWWNASVVRVLPQSEVPSDVDRRCLPMRNDAEPALARGDAAVVRYRVGRAPYTQAFVVGESQAFNAGDRVLVRPRRCEIKLARAAASEVPPNFVFKGSRDGIET